MVPVLTAPASEAAPRGCLAHSLRLDAAMPVLTRRRYKERLGCWHVYYGDVHVGTIARCIGNPGVRDRWQWLCGFYPGSNPGEQRQGVAATFDDARAGSRRHGRTICPNAARLTFRPWRDQRDCDRAKICHVATWRAVSIAAPTPIKFISDRPLADPETAARK